MSNEAKSELHVQAERPDERFRTAWIVGGRLALVVAAMVGVRLSTELLSPREIGRMALVLSLYQWFGFFFVSPVGLFVLRHANAWSVGGVLITNLRRMTAYFAVVAAATAVVTGVVQATLGWGVEVSALWLSALVGGNMLFVVLAGTNAACLNNLGRSWWFVGLGNLAVWGGLASATLLCLALRGRAEYWLTGLLVGQAMAWGLSVVVMFGIPDNRTVHPSQSRRGDGNQTWNVTPFGLRALWAFAGPIVPITLVYWFQTDGFRFVLQRQAGATDLGLFLVAFALGGTPVLAAEKLLVDLLSPAFYRQVASKDFATMKGAWEQYSRLLLPSVAICVAFAAGSGPLLARVLVGGRFESVGAYAAYGALFRGCFVATSCLLLWTHAVERTASPLPAYLVGAAVAIFGVFLFSPYSALHGTGLSLFASSLCTLILAANVMFKRYGIALPWGRLAAAGFACLPLLMAGRVFASLADSGSRVFAALLLAPLTTYCAAMCALFSGFLDRRRLRLWVAGAFAARGSACS